MICPHGIHMDNGCGACVPPRGTTIHRYVALPPQHPDTERLDWLQRLNSVKVDYYLRNGERVYMVSDMAWASTLGSGKTIREAIDAARGAKEQQ